VAGAGTGRSRQGWSRFKGRLPVAAPVLAGAAVFAPSRRSAGTEESIVEAGPPHWVLRECQVAHEPPLEMWEGKFVFLDGVGVHVWPAATCVANHLRSLRLAADSGPSFDERTDEGEVQCEPAAGWQGRRVLELGCGCGLVSVLLARWGAEVVATDANRAALALAEANAARHLKEPERVQLHELNWDDTAACAKFVEEKGPFDVIIICDGDNPCVGQELRSPPGPLLEATRALSAGGTEVLLAVAERAGDIAATARALLERRRWLDLASLPYDLVTGNGANVTVFHFRWRPQVGAGGETTRKLWATV